MNKSSIKTQITNLYNEKIHSEWFIPDHSEDCRHYNNNCSGFLSNLTKDNKRGETILNTARQNYKFCKNSLIALAQKDPALFQPIIKTLRNQFNLDFLFDDVKHTTDIYYYCERLVMCEYSNTEQKQQNLLHVRYCNIFDTINSYIDKSYREIRQLYKCNS